ncbi:two-component regulator propeller domain-containing protein [Mucilaginibacter angelicae]|uniref:histidine kinase n=1 Tax=Mucilaginibacter angelicae TaxID=869718 RepID=A0ABV6LF53_9SPHI
MLLKVALIIFFCSGDHATAALPPRWHIDRIGLKEGLSNSEVRCIFQDRRGFLWFGTYDGLNRYDGYDFKVYRNQPEDSSSIIHSYVNCIAQDSRNNLWVGTRQGVSILDPVTDKFSAVYAVTPGGRKITINSYIRDIKVDGNGDMLVASEGDGLIVFDKGSRVGHPVLLDTYAQLKWNYSVNALLVLPGNRIYVLISELGLCEYDVAGKKFHVLNSTVRGATCIYPDNGNLWLGTTIGLYHFNIRSATYDRFLNESNGGLKSNRITSLQAMPDSSLWVGTDGGGIQILDKNRTQISYLSEGYNEQGLSSNAVYSLLLDRNGRKWIGTLRGGINMIDEIKDRFQNIRHDPLNANSLISNFVKSLFEDREGKLWIGTDGGGLSIWDRRSGHFSNFRHDPKNPGTLGSDFVTSMIQDGTGKIWIATYGGGINLYLPRQNRFKVYHGLDAQGNESRITFWCLYVDHEGNLWASGLQDGLFLYDRKADQFKLFHAKLPNILSMCEDRAGNLWAGNFEGLYKINIKQGSSRFYSIGKPVRSIHSSAGGDLWLGTEAGLMYFGTLAGKVTKQFTTMAGLSNNNVLAIEEDHAKQLWLSTYNGLCRFDPKQTTFTNFFQSDGLASKEFNFNASLRLRNGQLAFGGTGGLTLFFPDRLVPLRNAPGIAFTDIRIDAKPLDFYPGFFSANEQNELVSLRIPYKNASLFFRFAAIEFTAQERIKYRYILQGWDRKWVDAGHQRNIFYTRLAPGSYVLKVNCTNPEGQWTKNELTLNIVVLPPWYATVWAFIAYALIVVGIIYWYMRNKFRETKLKYEVKLANADAEYQRNLQEKEKELNERRIEFFTGVAHEFRTPLSLIINPVKDLLAKSTSGERQDLNIVFRNSRRLLSLVDQLLLFRKADAVADALHIAPMDIVLVCREVYLCFVHQAKLLGINLELDAPADPVIIYCDREKIEIILFNLISNAIKYSAGGKAVSVQLDNAPNEVIIKVIDNGPGIPKEAGAHIFEKFYRSAKQGQKAGFGIGLYLAQQFTRRHHGQLYFESVPGTGTTFSLELLKGTDHFPGIVVSDEVDIISPLLDELTEENSRMEAIAEADETDIETKGIINDKKTILVVDDDAELRRYIRSLLVVSYIVYEAENGQIGLAMARDKQPDMIICDLMMPELNGIEVCTAIKSDPQLSYIPMILLTASASPESRIKGLESGADDYIQKPFEKDVLIARIANLLQNRDNLQQYFYNTITLKKASIAISDEYRQFLEKCIDIVERNITDENFSIKVLAAEIGMSHSNLYRKVKSLSGHTINSFIRYIRLRKAAELLIQSDMNVNEVAFETGFNSIKYFRSQFFKLFGANPSDFLKQKRPVFKKRFNVNS